MLFKASMTLVATRFLSSPVLAAPGPGPTLPEELTLKPRTTPFLSKRVDLLDSTIKSNNMFCADKIPRKYISNKDDSNFPEICDFHSIVPSWYAVIEV